MDKEIKKDEIIPAETEGVAPEVTGEEPESPAETTTEETNPNAEWKEIADQYAPGTDASNPQAILDAILPTIQKMIAMEEKVKDACATSPETAAFMSDVIDGLSVPKSFARNFDPEERQALLDEIGDDEYEADRNSYSDKVENKKAYEDHKESNRKLSQAGAEEFLSEINPSPEDENGFIKFTDEFLMDAADENLTKQRWMALWYAYKYPTDVATAEENGKIIGKNEKITSGKKTREDLKDLLPEGGVGATPKTEKPKSYKENFLNGAI